MTETQLQFMAFGKGIWAALFALLYGLGGINGKWKRRFLGPLWAMAGIAMFSLIAGTWSYWYLTYFPLLIGALSLGYGADTTGEKIRRRMVYGTAVAVSSVALAIENSMWVLYGLHFGLCVSVAVILGVVNPMKNARDEETVMATLFIILPFFMV